MFGTHGARAVIGALVAVVALVAAAPALGHGGRGHARCACHGQQLPTADQSVSTMVGDLNGTWTTTEFDFSTTTRPAASSAGAPSASTGASTSGATAAAATSDPAGALSFRFVYWAQLDPATGALIEGAAPTR